MSQENTLYELLGEAAPSFAAAGQTLETRAKETVDNDAETLGVGVAFAADAYAVRDLYLARAEADADTNAEPGQTRVTATKETVDNDREDLSLTLL
jgi:hypothetical protein